MLTSLTNDHRINELMLSFEYIYKWRIFTTSQFLFATSSDQEVCCFQVPFFDPYFFFNVPGLLGSFFFLLSGYVFIGVHVIIFVSHLIFYMCAHQKSCLVWTLCMNAWLISWDTTVPYSEVHLICRKFTSIAFVYTHSSALYGLMGHDCIEIFFRGILQNFVVTCRLKDLTTCFPCTILLYVSFASRSFCNA